MSLDRARFRKELQEALGVDELGERVDLMVYLNYVMFMEKLSKETEKEVKNRTKKGKTPTVRDNDIRQVDTVLKQLRK